MALPTKAGRRTPGGRVPQDVTEAVAVTDDQRRLVAMATSLLLDYPQEAEVLDLLDTVDAQLHLLPAAIAEELAAFTAQARDLGPRGLTEHYVETFDQKRRCSLFLSYYTAGDTRQRGTAILAFRQALEQLGFEEMTDELPDHLTVILEAIARSEGRVHDELVELLAAHRDGVEVLRSALQNIGSPFAHVVVAVAMAMPQIDEDTANRYIDLIRSGPPAEMVGINATLPFPSAQPDLI